MRKIPVKPGFHFHAVLLCMGLLLSVTVVSADDYTQWPYSAIITLNTAAAGANVTGTVTNFPVLIRLNPANFSGLVNTLPLGADVRFAKTNGTHLAYQIERWVDGAGNNDTAVIWVKLDTVFGANATQSIRMYWGKTGVADSSRGTAVFDTANGFKGVWHLSQTPPTMSDASGAANNGTTQGSPLPTSAAGDIGKCLLFQGQGPDQWVSTTNSDSNPNTFTISTWFNTGSDTGAALISLGNYQTDWSSSYDRNIIMGNNGKLYFGVNPGALAVCSTSVAYNDNNWHFVAGRLSSNGQFLYVDGQQVATNAGITTGQPDYKGWWHIGKENLLNWPWTATRWEFGGALDEVVVSHAERSADWIKLCYANQRAAQTLVTILCPPTGLTYKRNPLSVPVNIAITPDSAVVKGTVDSFTVSPALPAGLTLGKTTGIITGTPTAASAATNYTVTAQNAAGATTVTLSITVFAAPSNLSYKRTPLSCAVGTAIVPDSAVVTGTVDSFTVSPALPAGLSLAKATGIITGTPTTATAATNYTVTARNAAGSTTVVLSITVIAAPGTFSYKRNPVTFVVGTAIIPDTPVVTGTVDSFTVSPALPAGLSLAKPTGIVTGTPTAATARANYTVTARNAAGNATVALSIAVVVPPSNFSYKNSFLTCPAGTAIVPDTPVVTGTIDSFTVSPALPVGLLFSKITGIVSGTPSAITPYADYTVTARNAAGNATTTLSIMVTTANTKPTIISQPQSQVVKSGMTMSLMIIFEGNPSPDCHWYKNGTAINGQTGMNFTIYPATISDAGKYWAVVSNSVGSVTSDTAVIRVIPNIYVYAAPTAGKIPLAVSFIDSSTGPISKRYWYFGDNSAIDSSVAPSHTYTTEGSFNAKLVLFDNSGARVDSMTTVIRAYFDNPVLISSSLISTGVVEITYTNYSSLPAGPLAPFADSLALWYKPGAIPLSGTGATYAKNHLPSALQSQGATFKDTVRLALPLADSIYGFITTVHWTSGTWSTFAAGNGCLALVKDTARPLNTVTLSGAYVPKDTARLIIGNVSTIDIAKVDSMFIWYSLTNDTANFNDKTFTHGLSMQEVVNALVNGEYSYSIYNSLFNSAKKTVYCAVMVRGKNDLSSTAKKYQFTVGVDRPANPITLQAKALSATRIRLSWNDISSSGASRMVIWYRTGQPVDTTYDVTALRLDSLVPASLSDTVIIGGNFNQTTRYYFGAQVYSNGLWSKITTDASANDSTPAAGAPIDSATMTLLNLARVGPVFDTLTNTIRIGWTVNYSAVESLAVGISYSAVSAAADTVVGQTVQSIRNTDSATVKLREDLLFGTNYYVKLWLRRGDGKWTDPGPSSAGMVTTPSFTWQSVVYFTRDPDTVYAFNREIRLLNRPLDVGATVNTVRYRTMPALAIGDFTQVSIGVEFMVKDRGTPFFIGLKADSIPAGFTLADVRIYRDSAGLLLLAREQMSVDTVNRYVSLLTNDLDFPFVAMVDRRAPTHVPLTNITAFVPASKTIQDTIIIRDNIANCSWRFQTARGGSAYDTVMYKMEGFLNDTCETLAVTIDANLVTQDNGVRALLIISDGVHDDTLNLSRCVQRDGLDIAFTDAGNWAPLSVSAVLDTPAAKTVLRELPGVGYEWKYDDTKFRIFRCAPASGQPKPWKWVEYSDASSQDFDFVRGNVIWVKTLKQATVRFGPSHTASLTEVFHARIAPKAWTDFTLPFNFDINVGDIMNATANGDSLGFYVWQRDITTHRYTSDLTFMKAMSDVHYNNPATPLSGSSAWYTVYNPRSDTVILTVPPLPVAMSRQGMNKKSEVAGGWALHVASSTEDGSSLSTVHCGYTAAQRSGGVSYYPMSPSFGTMHVAVCDESGSKAYGIALSHASADGGYAFLLAFINDGTDAGRIMYHLENSTTLPKGLKAAVWNGNAGKFETFSPKGDAAVTVGAGAREYRLLVVGDAGYLAKARLIGHPSLLALVGTYPNPFKGSVRIRYSIPYEGVKSVKFTIYNLSGKIVWRHEVKDVTRSGASDLVWNGTGTDGRCVAAGVYVLRMSAMNNGSKPVGVFERKMTLLP
jgi:PKD repeat protein